MSLATITADDVIVDTHWATGVVTLSVVTTHRIHRRIYFCQDIEADIAAFVRDVNEGTAA